MPKQITENQQGLVQIFRASDYGGDIVFVHGLRGHLIDTWRAEELRDKEYWHNWLKKKFPNLNIWSFGYHAEPSDWLDTSNSGVSMPLVDRASNLLHSLKNDEIGQDNPLVFITHSLGGLIVKQVLRRADDSARSNLENHKIIEQTKGIVFLATPHTGASLARTFTYWLNPIGRPTVTIEELERANPTLRDLDRWYRENCNRLSIDSLVYFEKKPLHPFGLVVDEVTADPHLQGIDSTAVDEDHISIAKPKSENADVYKGVNRFIKKLIPTPSSLQIPLPNLAVARDLEKEVGYRTEDPQ